MRFPVCVQSPTCACPLCYVHSAALSPHTTLARIAYTIGQNRTNPEEAAEGSLRREILDKWEALKLPARPDVGDNGVHASASPLESVAEHVNWADEKIEDSEFGAGLLALGIPREAVERMMQDAHVNYGGVMQSVFDLLEDKDSSAALQALLEVDEGARE